MNNISNTIDKIEKRSIKIAKFIGLLLCLFLWGIIPIIILKLFNIDYQKLNQTIKIVITFLNDILFLLFIIWIYNKDIKKDFKNYFNKNIKNNFKKSFKTWLLGLSIMFMSNIIISILTNGNIANNEEAVRSLIDNYPLYMAFQLMIYAPLTEEIIFRKSIKEFINNKRLYIILSGLIFGGLHVISSISDTPLWFLYLIPYCSLGSIFAYLYNETDNIFSTITAHAIHNTLALILYLI